VPRADRREDQRVRDPAPASHRIGDQPHPGEVDLALHSRLAVRDPHRRALPPRVTPLDGIAGQRPIRHHHAFALEQHPDLRGRQALVDPDRDLGVLALAELPCRAVPSRPGRTHRLHDRADQRVIELTDPALAD